MPGLTNVVHIEVDGWQSFALRTDGTLWAWGWNYSGELGLGNTITEQLVPARVPGLPAIAQVSAGSSHTLARTVDGQVYAWGFGALGDGSHETRYTPVRVFGLDQVREVSAGSSHSVALKQDGTVYAWGSNYAGQLGNGTQGNASRRSPGPVPGVLAEGVVAEGVGFEPTRTGIPP